MVPGKKLLLCEAWCTVLCIHWNVYVYVYILESVWEIHLRMQLLTKNQLTTRQQRKLLLN